MSAIGRYIGKVQGGKLLKLDVGAEDGKISVLRIRGDFFANPEEGFDRVEASLVGIQVAAFAEALDRALASEGVELYGIGKGDILDAFQRAYDAIQAD